MATILLKARDRHYRRIRIEETQDTDRDGIPDVWDDDNKGENTDYGTGGARQ